MITKAYMDRLAQVESSNDPYAKNEKSTAKGLFQFVDATGKQYGLDKYEFGTEEYTNAETEAVKSFSQDNYSVLEGKLGRKPTNGELYLAHQQGAGGALKILQSDPSANAMSILGEDEVKNNGGNENTTIAEFRDKWASKFADLDQEQEVVKFKSAFDVLGIEIENSGDVAEVEETAAPQFRSAFDVLGVTLPEDASKPKGVNVHKGAPAFVRAKVGGVAKPADKLATLRKYYPDAKPHGDDNFIFTDTETGEKTLYNPEGFDAGLGDAASLTREAFVATGAGIGGSIAGGSAAIMGQLGPQAAVPEELITVPMFTAGGSTIGAMIGGATFDAFSILTGRVDTRTPSEMLAEASSEAASGLGGDVGGRVIGATLKAVAKPVEMQAKRVIEAFDAMGVTPTVASVAEAKTGSKAVSSRLQAAMAQSPLSGGEIEKVAQKQLSQVNRAIGRITRQIGDAKTAQGAGQTIRDAAEAVAGRFKDRKTEIYEEVFDIIGSDTVVDLNNIKELRKTVIDEISDAPRALGSNRAKMLKMLDDIILDAEEVGTGVADGLSFKAVRRIRTDTGMRMDKPSIIDGGSLEQSQLKAIYAALTLDISEASAKAGPEAAKKLKVADRYTRQFMRTAAKTMKKIADYDADERAFKYAIMGSKDGGTSLATLRKHFEPEEWDTIAASVFRRMGMVSQEGDVAEYSVARFLSAYKSMAPEAKQALFGGARYAPVRASLDDLMIVLNGMKDVEKYANMSNTAGAIHTLSLFNVLTLSGGGGAGTAAMGAGGGFAGVAAGATAVYGSAKIITNETAARLMANPSFIDWLAEPAKKGIASTAQINAHIAKLGTIATANPYLQDAIYEYSQALESSTMGAEK